MATQPGVFFCKGCAQGSRHVWVLWRWLVRAHENSLIVPQPVSGITQCLASRVAWHLLWGGWGDWPCWPSGCCPGGLQGCCVDYKSPRALEWWCYQSLGLGSCLFPSQAQVVQTTVLLLGGHHHARGVGSRLELQVPRGTCWPHGDGGQQGLWCTCLLCMQPAPHPCGGCAIPCARSLVPVCGQPCGPLHSAVAAS